MVAASPQAASSKNSSSEQKDQRPTERNNGQRRPRGKQVPSRYMSPTPSPSSSSLSSSSNTTSTSSSSTTLTNAKRFPSPLISRPANSASNLTTPSSRTSTLLPKRSQSATPRRPVSRAAAPVDGANAGEMSAATKMLITSTRSLSVSFQGEAFSLPISKKKETATPVSHRKSTPERRRSTPVRDRGENTKPVDQLRWPGTARKANSGSDPNQLSRSLDYGGDRRKLVGFGSGIVGQSLLRQSMIGESRKVSLDATPSLDLGNAEEFLLARDESKQNVDANATLASSVSCDLTASDTDSVSSGSTNGVQEYGGANGEVSRGKGLPRSIMASARFWQETNSRLRRLQDPGSPLSTSPSARTSLSSKFTQSKRFSFDGPLSSPRTTASPIRGSTRPASPCKLWASSTPSPSRGSSSPARVRNSVADQMSSYARETPSILSFSADIRRGKIGEDRVVDAHALRLLYNRYLQWRFVNARADSTFMVHILNAEKNLWSAWVSISELRHSVTLRRIKLLLLRQKLKLTSILKGQMADLEEWALLDTGHSSSLSGATEALMASTLRLPVVGKAIADIQDLKEAVGSAVDVMQAMGSSICSLSSKVEEMNSVIAELVNMTSKERAVLDGCKDLLSTVAAMQVTECSFKTHIIQLSRVPITGSLTAHV